MNTYTASSGAVYDLSQKTATYGFKTSAGFAQAMEKLEAAGAQILGEYVDDVDGHQKVRVFDPTNGVTYTLTVKREVGLGTSAASAFYTALQKADFKGPEHTSIPFKPADPVDLRAFFKNAGSFAASELDAAGASGRQVATSTADDIVKGLYGWKRFVPSWARQGGGKVAAGAGDDVVRGAVQKGSSLGFGKIAGWGAKAYFGVTSGLYGIANSIWYGSDYLKFFGRKNRIGRFGFQAAAKSTRAMRFLARVNPFNYVTNLGNETLRIVNSTLRSGVFNKIGNAWNWVRGKPMSHPKGLTRRYLKMALKKSSLKSRLNGIKNNWKSIFNTGKQLVNVAKTHATQALTHVKRVAVPVLNKLKTKALPVLKKVALPLIKKFGPKLASFGLKRVASTGMVGAITAGLLLIPGVNVAVAGALAVGAVVAWAAYDTYSFGKGIKDTYDDLKS